MLTNMNYPYTHTYEYQIMKQNNVFCNAAQKITRLFALYKASLQAIHKSSLEVSGIHETVHLYK